MFVSFFTEANIVGRIVAIHAGKRHPHIGFVIVPNPNNTIVPTSGWGAGHRYIARHSIPFKHPTFANTIVARWSAIGRRRI